jgi:hypothetical protein
MEATGFEDLQQFQMYFDKFFPHKVVTEFPHVARCLANACYRLGSCQECKFKKEPFQQRRDITAQDIYCSNLLQT